ncbi:MAG: OmpA family protein [Roseivirga sp.]|nr:OmpA family protein [Roseivirga sp.]
MPFCLKYILTPILFFTSIFVQAQGQQHIKIDSVNSAYDEQNPRLSPDGKRLYFTRSGHPQNVGGTRDRGDIWYADLKADGTWATAQNLGSVINHPGLNGVVGFSADGNTIYLLNYFDPEGPAGGTIRNGVSRSTFSNGQWSKPEKLKITYFANNSEYISASISADEKVLIMSLESFQTEGNEDLYVTFKQGDNWIQPRNLGSTINTFSEEWSPFLSADKSTLYFSSNGHGGEGSRDIYVSKRLDESWTNWTTPVNLGSDINSKGVELGYAIPTTGDMAFFSSTQNSEGFGDIFQYPLSGAEKTIQEIVLEPEPEVEEADPAPKEELETTPVSQKVMVVMTLQVLDKETGSPVDAQVRLSFAEETTEIDTREIESEDKKWIMSFEEGTRIMVNITADGYLNYNEEFVAESTAIVVDAEGNKVEGFQLTPNTVGTRIQIEKILFARGEAAFADTVQAQTRLQELVTLMKDNPEIAIRLEGHTDNQGNPVRLKELSQSRVDAVKQYLVEKGIAGSRIETVGLGGEKPIARNVNETGRSQNRRVEFIVIRN